MPRPRVHGTEPRTQLLLANNLLTRVLTAAILLPVVVAAAWAGGPWFWGIVALAMAIGWWEFATMGRRAGRRPWQWLGLLCTVGVCLLAATAGPWRELGLAATVFLILIATLGRGNHDGALEDASFTLFGVLWLGWLAGFAIHLRDGAGLAWLLTALAITWSADTAAYFTGRALGRHLLCPRISPKKTVEGLAGALVAVLIVGGLSATLVLHIPWWTGAAVGLIAGLASVAGDMVESLVKRQLGAKDSGTIMPGHGGLLDRIDSLLFAIPAVTACVILIQGG